METTTKLKNKDPTKFHCHGVEPLLFGSNDGGSFQAIVSSCWKSVNSMHSLDSEKWSLIFTKMQKTEPVNYLSLHNTF